MSSDETGVTRLEREYVGGDMTCKVDVNGQHYTVYFSKLDDSHMEVDSVEGLYVGGSKIMINKYLEVKSAITMASDFIEDSTDMKVSLPEQL